MSDTNSTSSSITSAISAIASLIPYVGQVAALAPAVVTLTQFVTDSIHNFHRAGEMTEAERDAFLAEVNNLKSDPAWQTDAERSTPPAGQ